MTVVDASVSADEQLVRSKVAQLLSEHPPGSVDSRTFLGAQFDLGLAWVHFPEGCGGLGLSPEAAASDRRAIQTRAGPNPVYRNPIGHGMARADHR